MIEIEVNMAAVMADTLKIETSHITEVETGIEKIEKDVVGTEEIVNLGIVVGQPLGIKVKRGGVICVED